VKVPRSAAKTDVQRRIPHLEPLPAWLRAAPPRNKSVDAPIVELKEKPFHQAISVLAKAAGVKIGPNALRHSFGTYFGHKHEDESKTAFLMGNSAGVVRRNYMNYSPESEDIELWWCITPKTAREAYADFVAGKKRGALVATKKLSKSARTYFVPKSGARSKAQQARSRNKKPPATKKRR